MEFKTFQSIWRPKANSVSLPLGLFITSMVNFSFDIYYEEHAKKKSPKKGVSNLDLYRKSPSIVFASSGAAHLPNIVPFAL